MARILAALVATCAADVDALSIRGSPMTRLYTTGTDFAPQTKPKRNHFPFCSIMTSRSNVDRRQRDAERDAEKARIESLDAAGWKGEEEKRKHSWYVGKITADAKFKAQQSLLRDLLDSFPLADGKAAEALWSQVVQEKDLAWTGDQPGELSGVHLQEYKAPGPLTLWQGAYTLDFKNEAAEGRAPTLREIFGVPKPTGDDKYKLDWYDFFGCQTLGCFVDSFQREGSAEKWLSALQRNLSVHFLSDHHSTAFIAIRQNNEARLAWLSTQCEAQQRLAGEYSEYDSKLTYLKSIGENIEDILEHHQYVEQYEALVKAERDVYVNEYMIAITQIMRYALADKISDGQLRAGGYDGADRLLEFIRLNLKEDSLYWNSNKFLVDTLQLDSVPNPYRWDDERPAIKPRWQDNEGPNEAYERDDEALKTAVDKLKAAKQATADSLATAKANATRTLEGLSA